MMMKLYGCFLIKDDDSLKKYDDIWNKVCKSINENLESEPICNNKI